MIQLRSRFFILMTCLLMPFSITLAGHPTPIYSQVYDPQRDPFVDGNDAIQLAKATGRKILIEIGGEWCQWCYVLEDVIKKNPSLQKTLHDHYVLLKVNVSEENKNEAFLASLPPVDGYPHLYISTTDGNIIYSNDMTGFFKEGSYSAEKLQEFLERWSADVDP